MLSKIFKKEATTHSIKLGQIYVVLLEPNTIKIGMTTVGMKRLKAYSGIARYLISAKIYDYRIAETLLIKEANNICGSPSQGREFFTGGETEFNMIKELVPESGTKHGIHPEKQYLIDIENDYEEYVRLQRIKESNQ